MKLKAGYILDLSLSEISPVLAIVPNCQVLLRGEVDLCRHCSIEDAKQKAEYDRMLLMAEEKKASVRKVIQSLRDQFQQLITRNSSLPPHLAINRKVRSAFHI